MAAHKTKKSTRKTPARKSPKAPARKPVAKKAKAAPKKVAPKRAAPKKAAPKRAAPKKKAAPRKAPQRAEKTATAVVEQVLIAAGWEHERHDEDGWTTFLTQVDDGGPIAATMTRLSEAIERLVLYIVFRETATDATFGEVVEFVLRANSGLGDGNFELNPETREVRFKAYLDYTGVPLSPLLVRNVILDAADVCEVYQEALHQVLRGETTALLGIAASESWEPEDETDATDETDETDAAGEVN